MKDSYEEVLNEVGFAKNEAKAYLALLELGSATAGQVAEKSKVHRTSIYDALERMFENGFVSYKLFSNVKYFQATQPQNLFRLLKEKEEKLNNVLPELLLKLQFSEKKSEAQIFQGVTSFMDILYNLLSYNEPILAYGIPKEAPIIVKNYIMHFHNKRMPMKIPMLHIYNYDATDRITFLNKLPHTQAKSLFGKCESHASTIICGDEVIITVWNPTPMNIQIKNKELADSYKKHFYVLWENAK